MLTDFRERGREGKGGKEREREGERDIDMREKYQWERETPTGFLLHAPDWRQDLQASGVRDDTPTNGATRPGHSICMSICHVQGAIRHQEYQNEENIQSPLKKQGRW